MATNLAFTTLRWCGASAATAVLLLAANCAPLPPTSSVVIPPAPGGAARIWIYRNDGPLRGQRDPLSEGERSNSRNRPAERRLLSRCAARTLCRYPRQLWRSLPQSVCGIRSRRWTGGLYKGLVNAG